MKNPQVATPAPGRGAGARVVDVVVSLVGFTVTLGVTGAASSSLTITDALVVAPSV